MYNIIAQDFIINKLNQYFKAQNLPFYFDEEGICNGLAHVYAEYVLDGKEQEFQSLMNAIAGGKISNRALVDEVNLFATKILLTFVPQAYDKQLSQATAIQALRKSVVSSINFGMVLEDKSWIAVFKELALQENIPDGQYASSVEFAKDSNEVMIINSIDHTIAVHKKKGKYVIYDPNYLFGFKEFKTESALVKELHKNVFTFKDKAMGIRIHIVRNTKFMRDTKLLYQKYLNPENINNVATINKATTNTLSLVTQCDDEESIMYLLDQGAKFDILILFKAIRENHTRVLSKLIPEVCDESYINSSIIVALNEGRKEAFDVLLKTERVKNAFQSRFLPTNKPLLIKNALEGGNPVLFKYILEQCIHEKTSQHSFQKAMNRNQNAQEAICAAIKGKNPACLKLLLQEFQQHTIEITEDVKMHCLMYAIKTNQMYMCNLLLKTIDPNYIELLMLSLELIEKTNVFILKDLQTHNVKFWFYFRKRIIFLSIRLE